jgi:hypothetical protein
MIHRLAPDSPICLHCGTAIEDPRDGQGKIVITDGRIVGGEYYVHETCGWAFEQDHALPYGQSWAYLPLAEPWRAWAVAAFVEAPLLAARAAGS